MQLEMINKLFLELSQFTSATTKREAELERLNGKLREQISDLVFIIGNIEQVRTQEGHSVTILCDNPEADTVDVQAAVEVACDFTDWEPQRFYGRTWQEAIGKAADASRLFNSASDCR